MFDNFLVRKQVVLDHKILILNSGHIGFSQRGRPMILVKKWKFYICMFLGKWALQYCLMNIEVENKLSQTRLYKFGYYKAAILRFLHRG